MVGWQFKVFPALLIVVVLIGFIYTVRQWHDCNEAGGEYMRGMSGFYKCVEGKEVFIR